MLPSANCGTASANVHRHRLSEGEENPMVRPYNGFPLLNAAEKGSASGAKSNPSSKNICTFSSLKLRPAISVPVNPKNRSAAGLTMLMVPSLFKKSEQADICLKRTVNRFSTSRSFNSSFLLRVISIKVITRPLIWLSCVQ